MRNAARYQAFKSLRDCGFSVKEIAEVYRVTTKHVYHTLRRCSSPERYEAYREYHRKNSEARRRRRGIPPAAKTDGWRQQAFALRHRGFTYREVAETLGKTRNQIAGALYRHKAEFKASARRPKRQASQIETVVSAP